MSDLVNPNTNAALCGQLTAVCMAKVENLTEEADGSVTVVAGTEGNNDNVFKVVVRAREAAAKQLVACRAAAQKKGEPLFRFMASGPCEVELETNKVGKENQPLSLTLAAVIARAVHPSRKIEPNQNSAVLMGRIIRTTFNGGGSKVDLQFGHLTSAIDSAQAPAAVKLSGGSVGKLEPYADQDVMVTGSFTRHTGLEQKDGIPAHDSVSFTVDSAQLIQIAAGRTRYQSKRKDSADVVVNDYEQGFEGNESNAEEMKQSLKDMDF